MTSSSSFIDEKIKLENKQKCLNNYPRREGLNFLTFALARLDNRWQHYLEFPFHPLDIENFRGELILITIILYQFFQSVPL